MIQNSKSGIKTEFQTILYGIGVLQEVVSSLGVQRLMLVVDASFPFLNINRQVLDLKVPYVLFDQFGSNPLYEDVCKGVDLFRKHQCDAILAVGGGSCIDVAKCIKLYCRMEPSIMYLEQEPFDSNVPLIAIPTTAGTGSESTRFAVIYYEGKKQSVNHLSIIPNYAILEPEVLRTLPEYQKKCTAMDALCQGIESWWSLNSTETSRELSRQAVRILSEKIVPYIQGTGDEATDRHCAEEVMEAANKAGQAINITQTTAPHAFSYKLTSLYGFPHGHAVAVCLPDIWQYMIDNMGRHCIEPRGEDYLLDIFAQIAHTLGCSSPSEGVVWMRSLLDVMQLPSPVGRRRDEEIGLLTTSVNPVRLKNNPVAMDSHAIRRIYEHIVK